MVLILLYYRTQLLINIFYITGLAIELNIHIYIDNHH